MRLPRARAACPAAQQKASQLAGDPSSPTTITWAVGSAAWSGKPREPWGSRSWVIANHPDLSVAADLHLQVVVGGGALARPRSARQRPAQAACRDRKSTRLNSSHANISYA